jgi:hypothetical protein
MFERARDPGVSKDTALYVGYRHNINFCCVLADQAVRRNC